MSARRKRKQRSGAQVTHCEKLPEGALLYTRRQMAAALQISVRYLDSLRRDGRVRELRMNDRIIRFHPAEVLRYLEEKAAGGREQAAGICDQSPSVGDQWAVAGEQTNGKEGA